MLGSSPLARGLPRPAAGGRRRRRIIPARAGFTTSPGKSRATRADHPRSRGVYSGMGFRRSGPEGSSPLARGLQTRIDNEGVLVRIIPARAGFT